MSNTISLRIPSSYHRAIQEAAKAENVSMNQLITAAIGEKLSALQTEDYISKRAAEVSRAKFDKAFAQVPEVEPEWFDRING